jgi:hypothetical protein
MGSVSKLIKDARADCQVKLAPAERQALLSEAELNRVSGAGGPGTGGFGGGGGGSRSN